MPRHAVHPDDHGDHKNGRDQKQHAFKSVFANLPALQRDGDGEAGRNRGEDASPHPAREIRPPGAVQINEYDADDQGGFDTFTKSDEESREQKAVLKIILPASQFTGPVRRKGKARTQNGVHRGTPSSCNSFATGNTSLHAPSTTVKFASF